MRVLKRHPGAHGSYSTANLNYCKYLYTISPYCYADTDPCPNGNFYANPYTLFQFEHFRRWRELFPGVSVIDHQTQRNKIDPEFGVEALLPSRYRSGMKHLPKKEGVESLNFLRQFERELTTYPFHDTVDCVLADWIGEWNLDRICSIGRRGLNERPGVEDQSLPPYLRRQVREHSLA